MILPHASDHLVSGFSAQIGYEHAQRVLIVRRKHPGRRDGYVMIHQISHAGEPEQVWHVPLDEDLTDKIEIALFRFGPMSYPLVRFDGEPTLKDALELGKSNRRLRYIVENVLGMPLSDLSSMVRWKP